MSPGSIPGYLKDIYFKYLLGSSESYLKLIMNKAEKLLVYHAQTKNVMVMSKAWKHINILINNAIRKHDHFSVQTLTRTLTLVFSAWAEANFSKLIHTPHGFTNVEISQIKAEYKTEGMEAGWNKCLDLALQKVSRNRQRSNFVPNVRQRLKRIIKEYVIEPRGIRNKIAHGQWEVALNSNNEKINNDISASIQTLDPVVIKVWFDVYKYLSEIVECLIESPNRVFHRDYWVIVNELDEYIEKTRGWNKETKEIQLSKKPVRVQSPS